MRFEIKAIKQPRKKYKNMILSFSESEFELFSQLRRTARASRIPTTRLTKQMIEHCLSELRSS